MENGIPCVDMIRLRLGVDSPAPKVKKSVPQ